MIVNYDLVIDFARPSKSNTILIAEDDANSRNCRFKLLADKQPFDMTDVVAAVVNGILPDGSIIIDEATIVQDEEGNNINEVTYLVPNALAATPGTITLTISLNDNLGARITSFEFYLKVRNALYNEDDYINDDDLDGFRDLLARSQAALEKMEQMTENDALPNPYPIRIHVDGVDYEYKGDEQPIVDIRMGDVAYLGEVSGEVEITEDDSAAQQAIEAAEEAAASAEDCAQKLDEMTDLYNSIDAMVPTATIERDAENHKSVITITDRNGTTSSDVPDGEKGDPGDTPEITVSATVSSDDTSGTPSVTVTKSGTDTEPSFAFAFEHLKGQKGDPGTGVSVLDTLESTSTDDALSANMGHTLKGMVEGAEDLVKDTVGWTGKNLLHPDMSSLTLNGLTFTVNDDKSIKINGTASADVSFRVGDLLPEDCPNNFIVTGLPADGSASTYNFRLGTKQSASDASGSYLMNVFSASGGDLNVSTAPTYGIALVINIANGTSLSNLLFKPMIRKATIVDSTYEPYHASVEAILEGKGEWDCRNLATLIIDQSFAGSDAEGYDAPKGSPRRSMIAKIDPGKTYTVSKKSGVGDRFRVIGFPTNYPTGDDRVSGTELFTDNSGNTYTFTNSSNYAYVGVTLNVSTSLSSDLEAMVQLASNQNQSYTPHRDVLDDVIPSKMSYADNGILGAKNRFPFAASSSTQGGYTFTANSNGTVSVSGSDSTEQYLNLTASRVNLSDHPIKTGMIFSGCEGGSATTYWLTIAFYDSSNQSISGSSIILYEGERSITVPSNAAKYRCYITIHNTSASDLVFNPMLRLASDPDDTYVPYAMTNKELTDSKFDRSEQRVLGAKNLVNCNMPTSTVHSVVCTSVGDGTFSLDGTNNGTAIGVYLASYRNDYADTLSIPDGKYILSGGVAGHKLILNATLKSGGSGSNHEYQNTGSDIVVEVDNTNYVYRLYVWMAVSESYDNALFKPMLRLASDPDDTFHSYANTNKGLTDDLSNLRTRVNKVIQERVTLTSAVSAGSTVYIPGGNSSSYWGNTPSDLDDYIIIPAGDKSDHTPIKYTTCQTYVSGSLWQIKITVAEDLPANTDIGAIIFKP